MMAVNSLPSHRMINPRKSTPTCFLRLSLVICMILTAAAFLHICNYRPKQTFLSCDRPCHHLDWPMICRVKLTLEPFHSMSKSCGDCPANETACLDAHCVSADGQRRGILSVNRLLPGPSIQVCENDILVVDVVNRLPGKAAAIHWRGQTQRETPCMDGVPLVTQCPIPSYTTFQYKFRAAIPGTHLWHSHSGADVANGIFGSLIVRRADVSEPHRSLYDVDDPDHVVLISHWHHSIVTDTGHGNKKPALLLVNGKGRQQNGPQTPLTVFTVTPGSRHRFRIANAGGAAVCPVTLIIEEHFLQLIALDGNPVEAQFVRSITLGKGERADFILKADKIPADYHLHVHTTKSCGSSSIDGQAILRYSGKHGEKIVQNENTGLKMSTDPVERCGTPDNLCLSEIKSFRTLTNGLNSVTTDMTIYLPIDQRMHTEMTGHIDTELETIVLSVNNATFTYPSSPLLTQGTDVPEDMICSTESDPRASGRCRRLNVINTCECVNTRRIPLGATVEIILLDQVGRDDLVYHLHGYSFHIVAARKFTTTKSLDEVKELNERGLLFVRNLVSPPLKDTVVVPKFGAVALRFKADNPGYWMLRDENALEWTRGLDVILQVGEPGDMAPYPEDFPKCGSFIGPDYFLV